jgi:hypothetical protein
MALIDSDTLIAGVSKKVDARMASALIAEFRSLERRFVLRDWEPAELDGGQFCEILARLIYHADCGILNDSKPLDDCLRYLENDQVTHAIVPRHDALHFAKMLRATYKFRSQRGAVHISPHYTANQMDAKLISECVKWCFSEFLRLYWSDDRDEVAKAIREISQFDVPSIGKFGGKLIVQRVDLGAEEEILVLLHYAGEEGFSRTDIGKYVMASAPTITRALQKLIGPQTRQIVRIESGYRLTDLGSKRVLENLADKLTL